MMIYREQQGLGMEGIRMTEFQGLRQKLVEWQLNDETKLFDEWLQHQHPHLKTDKPDCGVVCAPGTGVLSTEMGVGRFFPALKGLGL
jgi:hypothetical protein